MQAGVQVDLVKEGALVEAPKILALLVFSIKCLLFFCNLPCVGAFTSHYGVRVFVGAIRPARNAMVHSIARKHMEKGSSHLCVSDKVFFLSWLGFRYNMKRSGMF